MMFVLRLVLAVTATDIPSPFDFPLPKKQYLPEDKRDEVRVCGCRRRLQCVMVSCGASKPGRSHGFLVCFCGHQIRDRVLAVSMDTQMEQTMNTRNCEKCRTSIYDCSLICSKCSAQSPPCVVSGTPRFDACWLFLGVWIVLYGAFVCGDVVCDPCRWRVGHGVSRLPRPHGTEGQLHQLRLHCP